MKPKQLIVLILLSGLLLLTGCGKRSYDQPVKPLIITTIYPYELIVRQLVDTLFTVQTLLPPDASPHSWSPGPRDIVSLRQADLVISNGLGLETNLEKYLSTLGKNHLVMAELIKDKLHAVPKEETVEAHGQEHKHSTEINPHIWTSPDLLTDMILALSAELGKRYPMLQSGLESKARLMIMELNRVDGKIKTEVMQSETPAVITLHDAFVYFFDYFHIEYLGAVQPAGGKEPSPRQLSELADKVRQHKIKAIFIEPRMNPQPAQILARELGLNVLQYDDLGTTLKVRTIAEYIWQNWLLIKQGL
jgi:zinc transport system substrate-binding protein